MHTNILVTKCAALCTHPPAAAAWDRASAPQASVTSPQARGALTARDGGHSKYTAREAQGAIANSSTRGRLISAASPWDWHIACTHTHTHTHTTHINTHGRAVVHVHYTTYAPLPAEAGCAGSPPPPHTAGRRHSGGLGPAHSDLSAAHDSCEITTKRGTST
eukprot:1156393-Pelagomonas_calceolata.AAC.7